MRTDIVPLATHVKNVRTVRTQQWAEPRSLGESSNAGAEYALYGAITSKRDDVSRKCVTESCKASDAAEGKPATRDAWIEPDCLIVGREAIGQILASAFFCASKSKSRPELANISSSSSVLEVNGLFSAVP